MLSLLVYLSHPELAVKSTLLSGPAFSSNFASLFLLIHYNLMGPLSDVLFLVDRNIIMWCRALEALTH